MNSRIHYLKTIQPYFDDVYNGLKTFEVRRNDRGFELGDILHLQEFDGAKLTGREISVNVTYIISNPTFCKDGFVIMGIKAYVISKEVNHE